MKRWRLSSGATRRSRRRVDGYPSTADRSRGVNPPTILARMPRKPALGALLQAPCWCWLCCPCGHRVAVALVPFVIRWGPPTLRRICCARTLLVRSAEDVGRAVGSKRSMAALPRGPSGLKATGEGRALSRFESGRPVGKSVGGQRCGISNAEKYGQITFASGGLPLRRNDISSQFALHRSHLSCPG